MTDKAALRATVRSRMNALSAAERVERSRRICDQITALPSWEKAGCLGLFSALPDEPQLLDLIALRGERKVCLPRMHGDDLIFLEVQDPGELTASRWNLLEPVYREAALIPVEELDLLFLPGVAFTRQGHRMGRGRGYYDRLLASPAFRAETIGICFSVQLVDALPLEPHDCPVSAVIDA